MSKYLILFFSISMAIEIISHRYMFFSVIAHIFPVQRKHFYTLEVGEKKIFCVLKQHRGYLGHRRKLLLSWLECLVRLKRIKSLKINERFKRHSESECADQSSIGSIPQRIVRLDKCGFFLVCHLIVSL